MNGEHIRRKEFLITRSLSDRNPELYDASQLHRQLHNIDHEDPTLTVGIRSSLFGFPGERKSEYLYIVCMILAF